MAASESENAIVEQVANAKEKEGFFDDEDRIAVSDLVHLACIIQEMASKNGDYKLQEDVNRFSLGLIHLYQLVAAFRVTPRRTIRGQRGVARRLNLSHNAVYARLEALGLTPKDFWEPELRIAHLIQRSSILAPLAQRFLQMVEEGDQGATPRRGGRRRPR